MAFRCSDCGAVDPIYPRARDHVMVAHGVEFRGARAKVETVPDADVAPEDLMLARWAAALPPPLPDPSPPPEA